MLTQPDGHHEQTSLWGSVRATIGWKVSRVVITEGGSIIAGAQVQLQSVGWLGCWAYITFGPCIAGDDPLAGQVLMAEIKDFLRRNGALYLLVQLPYDAHHFAERLRADGFIPPPRAITSSYMQATLVIDLAKPEEKILAEMNHTKRHHIRQGMKRGIVVEQGGDADLDVLWELMRVLCVRRNTPPNPASADFFRELWKQFSPRGWIKLFVAKHQGKPVTAALAIPFGGWFRVWKMGWSGEHGELRPNQILWWEMIRHARSNGFRHFDFVNLDMPPGHPASATLPATPTDGPTEFKLGFGGIVKTLPGAYCYFISPFARVGQRIGLTRLLDTDACVSLARKAWRRR